MRRVAQAEALEARDDVPVEQDRAAVVDRRRHEVVGGEALRAALGDEPVHPLVGVELGVRGLVEVELREAEHHVRRALGVLGVHLEKALEHLDRVPARLGLGRALRLDLPIERLAHAVELALVLAGQEPVDASAEAAAALEEAVDLRLEGAQRVQLFGGGVGPRRDRLLRRPLAEERRVGGVRHGGRGLDGGVGRGGAAREDHAGVVGRAGGARDGGVRRGGLRARERLEEQREEDEQGQRSPAKHGSHGFCPCALGVVDSGEGVGAGAGVGVGAGVGAGAGVGVDGWALPELFPPLSR